MLILAIADISDIHFGHARVFGLPLPERDQGWIDPVALHDEPIDVLQSSDGVHPTRRCDAGDRAVGTIAKQGPMLGIKGLLEEVEAGSPVAAGTDGLDHLAETAGAKRDAVIRARRRDDD